MADASSGRSRRRVRQTSCSRCGRSPGVKSIGLQLRRQVENEHDQRALLVTDSDHALGWVPQPLLELSNACLESGELSLEVLRANGADAGDHLRLLVRAEGRLPGAAPLLSALWHAPSL